MFHDSDKMLVHEHTTDVRGGVRKWSRGVVVMKADADMMAYTYIMKTGIHKHGVRAQCRAL